jgi:DNA-binding MarR family transcriptional regulator
LTIQSIRLHSKHMVNDVERLMSSYPQIYFACHRRHIRDDETGTTLTLQQAGILDHLQANRQLTISKLARHLGVTDSTASTGIARLEKCGYVGRLRDVRDKRRVLLSLTVAGRRIVQQNSVLDADDVRDMLRLIAPAERRRTLDAIEVLALAARELLRKREQRTPKQMK